MRKREASHKAGTFGLLAGGLAWLVVAIAVIATIGFAMQVTRRGRGITPPGSWTWYFMETSLIATPLLFILERATEGTLLRDAADEHASHGPMAQRMMGRGMVFVILIEMGLWGPRALTRAFRRISGTKSIAGADRNAAAMILANLLRGNDGLPTGQALAGVPDALSSDALAYLAYFDWVDIAKDGSRVWILSDAKKHLIA